VLTSDHSRRSFRLIVTVGDPTLEVRANERLKLTGLSFSRNSPLLSWRARTCVHLFCAAGLGANR